MFRFMPRCLNADSTTSVRRRRTDKTRTTWNGSLVQKRIMICSGLASEMRPTDSLPPYLPPTNRNFRRGEKVPKCSTKNASSTVALSITTFLSNFFLSTDSQPTPLRNDCFSICFRFLLCVFFPQSLTNSAGRAPRWPGRGGS